MYSVYVVSTDRVVNVVMKFQIVSFNSLQTALACCTKTNNCVRSYRSFFMAVHANCESIRNYAEYSPHFCTLSSTVSKHFTTCVIAVKFWFDLDLDLETFEMA